MMRPKKNRMIGSLRKEFVKRRKSKRPSRRKPKRRQKRPRRTARKRLKMM